VTVLHEPDATLAALELALAECADDDELLARVRALDGGTDRVVRFLADGMASAFRPERAAGASAVVRFVVATGDGRAELWLRIEPDGCRTVAHGTRADTTVTAPLPVLLRIAFKQLTGTDAYIDGRVQVGGDVVLATTLDDWFDVPGRLP
jgi:hypothetical protein